MDNSLCG